MKKISFILFFLLIILGSLSAQIMPITGPSSVCVASTITLSDVTTGGTWSSFNTAVATIGSTGIITGVSPGVDTILYTIGLTGTSVLITVNPVPVLSSALIPPAICDSNMFSYIPAGSISGTSFAWSRPFIIGIAEPASSGIGNPNEQLINTTNDPLNVVYVYTLSASGCANTQNVVVTVNPTPVLSSSLTPPSLCDSEVFNYTPMSFTTGATFTWGRATVTGIFEPGSSGAGNPNEQLINTTPDPIPVAYIFTLSANGCLHTQDVTVTLNPTPVLSSTLTPPAICDSQLFNYMPTSATPGTLYAWNRPMVAGITPLTAFAGTGSGIINEKLYNSTSGPVVVTYIFRLSVGGCTNAGTQDVSVTVDTCASTFLSNLSGPDENIKVYPNPANGAFTIEIPKPADNVTITVSDMLGKVIEHRNAGAGAGIKEDFKLNNIPPGTYFIKVSSADKVYREKLVIW